MQAGGGNFSMKVSFRVCQPLRIDLTSDAGRALEYDLRSKARSGESLYLELLLQAHTACGTRGSSALSGPVEAEERLRTAARQGDSRSLEEWLRVHKNCGEPGALMIQLDLDHELTLVHYAAGPDDLARTLLWRTHQPCIDQIANNFYCPKLEAADLRQIGYIGFLRTIRNFDITRRINLWVFASPAVWRAMRDACLRACGLTRDAELIWRTRDRLYDELGREPTPQEIALATGKAVGDVLTISQIGWSDSLPPDLVDPDGDIQADLRGWEAVLEILGEEAGQKFIVLFVLKEQLDYTWKEVVQVLHDQTALSWWADECVVDDLPPVVPRDWGAVCSRFASGTPLIGVDALTAWYGRCLSRLRKYQGGL